VNDRTRLYAAVVGVPSSNVAVVVVAVALMFAAVAAATIWIRRRRSEGGIDIDSPTAILEEVRKRLEDLPTLPEFATGHDGQLPLVDPFVEPKPMPREIVAPAEPAAAPAPLPSRKSAPPLPTNAEDPITGETDEEAYREWLREWLVYAEQYSEEVPIDPTIQ